MNSELPVGVAVGNMSDMIGIFVAGDVETLVGVDGC